MDLIFDENNRYGRSISPAYSELCRKLSDRYKGTAYVTSSGMNAISTLLRVLLDNADSTCHIVYADELYSDLPRLLQYLSKASRSTLHEVRITDTSSVQKLLTSLKDEKVILYFETCSNPHGMIFDFEIIKSLKAENPQLVVVVDNTWVSSVCFNPLDWYADFVVSSLTKYYSNSKSLGGVIVSRNSTINDVGKYIRFHGLHVSPHNCKVISDNLDTIDERMSKAYATMLELFKLLEKDIRFKSIIHPALESHFSHQEYMKYISPKSEHPIGPSVFTMRIKGNEKAVKRIRSGFQHIKYKTSFGGADTRYDNWYKGTNGGYTHCRISVGYNSTAQEIYQDLTRNM